MPKPTLTHDEIIAVDNMLLKHIGDLRALGAQDLAAMRLDLRDRVLKILDEALQVR